MTTRTITIVFFATSTSSITDPRNERVTLTPDEQYVLAPHHPHAMQDVVAAAAGGGIAEWTATPRQGVGEMRIVKRGQPERHAQVRYHLG